MKNLRLLFQCYTCIIVFYMFGSNVNHDQDSQDNVQESRTHNENNLTCDFPTNYTTQSTTLTIYCLCTCWHKIDIQRLQCIIFKESKYHFNNNVVVEALSNRFTIPTSKEYICKKCDKDLLKEIMPMNSVASQIWLTSNEPQQKYIHCNTVPTHKFLTFDKTKYRKIQLWVKWKKMMNKTSYVTSVTMWFAKNPLLHVSHTWKLWENVYIEIWYGQILLTGKQHMKKWQNHRKPSLTYAKAAMYNCNKKLYVCVVTDICRNIYVKCTGK